MLNQDELYWSNNWKIDFWVCIHIYIELYRYRYIQHDTCVRFLTFWSGDGHVAPICVLGLKREGIVYSSTSVALHALRASAVRFHSVPWPEDIISQWLKIIQNHPKIIIPPRIEMN